jgi:hypothetical protein
MPSAAPLPPIRLTPAPMTGVTPIPGLLSPVPGTLTAPSPTTLSAATGQQVAGGRSKTGFIIAGAAVVAIAGGAIVLLASKKSGGTTDDSKAGSNVVSMSTGSAETTHVTAPPPPPMIDAAVAPPPIDAAAVPATTGSAAGSDMTVKPPVKVKLTITSTPEGAEIYFSGVDQHAKTNTTLEVERGKVPALITLKLHGYQDAAIKDLASATGDELTRAVKLVKVSVPVHTPSGHGSAAPAHSCEDCLERPE